MNEDDDEPRGLIAYLRAQSGVIVATSGLIAWLALIWFMFGDVL